MQVMMQSPNSPSTPEASSRLARCAGGISTCVNIWLRRFFFRTMASSCRASWSDPAGMPSLRTWSIAPFGWRVAKMVDGYGTD